tara:strand:- start:509 stop:5011 length:4503 start_codon:yes stop_codon:yes gene_type:complete
MTTIDGAQNPQLDLAQARALKRMSVAETTPIYFPQQSYTPQNTYSEDLADYFALSWIGQVLDQKNYTPITDNTIDPNYDPFLDDFEQYLPYADQFVGIRNQEAANQLKEKIDANNARRRRVQDSGRVTPALLSAFFDPVTYIPIPLARGVGFLRGAKRAGLATGALVGATEPVRLSLDPTSTWGESATYIGFGTIAGGLLGGAFGSLSQRMGATEFKKLFPKAEKQLLDEYWEKLDDLTGNESVELSKKGLPLKTFGGETIHITPKNWTKGMRQKSGESQKQFEYRKRLKKFKTQLARKDGESKAAYETRVADEYTKLNPSIPRTGFEKRVDVQKLQEIDKKLAAQYSDEISKFDDVAEYFPKERRMVLDIAVLKAQFQQQKHYAVLKFLPKKEVDKYFKTSADWVKFNHWKAGNRKIMPRGHGDAMEAMKAIDPKGFKSLKIKIGPTNSWTSKGAYRPAFYNHKTNVIKIDMEYLKKDFANMPWTKPKLLGVKPLPAKSFQTADEWADFVMLHEYSHSKIRPEDMGFTTGKLTDAQRSAYENAVNKNALEIMKKIETDADYMYRLNTKTFDEIKKYKQLSKDAFETAGLSILKNIFEGPTNVGGVINSLPKTVKDKELAKQIALDMLETAGDFGTTIKASSKGFAVNGSVAQRIMQDHQYRLIETISDMENDWMKLLGYNPQQAGTKKSLAKVAINIDQLTGKFKNWYSKRKAGDTSDKLSRDDYMEMVSQYHINPKMFEDQKFATELKDALKTSAKRMEDVFERYRQEAVNAGMFKSQKSFQQMIEKHKLTRERYSSLIKNKKVFNKLPEEAQTRIKAQFKKKDQFIELNTKDDVMGADFDSAITNEKYFTRNWKENMVVEKADELKGIFESYILKNMDKYIRKAKQRVAGSKYYKANPEKVPDYNNPRKFAKAEAEHYYNDILESKVRFQDPDGVSAYGRDIDGEYKIGAKQLLTREIDIDNAEVLDFIETNATVVLRQYVDRMAPAVELARRFGDTHMIHYLDNLEIDLILDGVEATQRAKIINGFRDVKDNLMGVLFSGDPMGIGSQTAGIVRSLASYAYMGKVIYSVIPELARPIMVNGVQRTWEHGLKGYFKGLDDFAKTTNINELQFLAPIVEGNLQSASTKIIFETMQHTNSNAAGIFAKINKIIQYPKDAFFQLNLLTPYTRKIKEVVRSVSAHRFMEDIVKWTNNKLDKDGITRLNSYGIDNKMATLIRKLSKVDDQIDANGKLKLGGTYKYNVKDWINQDGGIDAHRAFGQAIQADVNRTIVTPHVADQYNMMHGVLRINNEGIARMMDNPLMRAIGFQKTDLGGKINNAWLGLMLQFYSWGISANRKILLSAAQGRDGKGAQLMAGIGAAIGMGYIGDWAKNPRYHGNKEFGEKLVRAVELSGITALAGDANFMLETVSGGLFDNSVGLRPLLGLENRFGEVTGEDAAKEIIGSGPSMVVDLINAFTNDSLSDVEKKTMIRKLIPFNNYFIWDQAFRDMYNNVVIGK